MHQQCGVRQYGARWSPAQVAKSEINIEAFSAIGNPKSDMTEYLRFQDPPLLDTVQPSSKMLWYRILPLLLYSLLTPDNANTQILRPGDMGAANPNQAEILDIDFPANGPPR